jgi:hypothetical protein
MKARGRYCPNLSPTQRLRQHYWHQNCVDGCLSISLSCPSNGGEGFFSLTTKADRQSNSEEHVLHVPSGSASHPRARFLHRLNAPWRWWSHSMPRRLLEEFRNFPRRILALLRQPSLSRGPTLPIGPEGHNLGSFCEVNNWLDACTQSIQHLQNQHPWIGALDFQILAQAFALGAGWAYDNAYTKKHTEAVQP